MGNGRGQGRESSNRSIIDDFLDLITDLLSGLNYFKMNISYETLMKCTFDELDYWIARANKLIEEEKVRQEESE